MRTGDIPFQFNISLVLKALVRRPDALPSAIRLDLPFLSVLVSPSSIDVSLARDLLVRMRDRRVLDAQECCDGCIADALTSLQQIRGILLDLQIQLRDADESALSPLVELMAVGIRQFLTFEQSLRRQAGSLTADERGWETRQIYFDALEQLRGHLSRCLGQIAVVAGVAEPSDGLLADYRGPWQIPAYVDPGQLLSDQYVTAPRGDAPNVGR